MLLIFMSASASPNLARFESGRSSNALMYCLFAAEYVRALIAESAAANTSCIFLSPFRYDATRLASGAFALRSR